MTRLITAELFKLRKRRMTWVLIALVPALVAFAYILLVLVAAVPPTTAGEAGNREYLAALDPNNLAAFGDGFAFRCAAIAAIILAGVSVASEFRWRTALAQAAWTGEQRRSMIARLAVYALFCGVAVGVGFVAIIVCAIGVSAARGELAIDAPGPLAVAILFAALRDWFIVLVFAALAAMIGAWSRSSAAAVAIPLVVLLLEPLGTALLLAAGGTAAAAANLTLSQNIDAVLAANGAMRGGPALPDDLPSVVQGTVFLALFTAVTAWVTVGSTRRDLE